MLTERQFTKAELAQMLGCSVNTIQRDIKKGWLCAHRFGKKTIIFHSDAEKYIAFKRVKPKKHSGPRRKSLKIVHGEGR